MKSPKEIEERLNTIRNAWRIHAPDKTFGGMTLEQYETEIAPSFTARKNLADIDAARDRETNSRDDADDHSLDVSDKVVAGVVGDKDFGADSSTYEAMGYTRKSERKSGLTRKGGGSPPKPPPV
jgi:hypothetical protein